MRCICGNYGAQPSQQFPPRQAGFGDTIAAVTGLLGFKPCEPCKARQAALNCMFPYRGPAGR